MSNALLLYRNPEGVDFNVTPRTIALHFLSERHRRWLLTHARLEFEHRLREKAIRKARRRGEKRRRGWGPTRYAVFRSPIVLDFAENFERTIGFVEQIRKASTLGLRPLFIAMRSCKSLAPEVALVLAAEIERCTHFRPKTINGNNPKEPTATAMLRDIGFFRLLSFNEPEEGRCEPGTTYLGIKTGVQGGGQHADALRALVLGDVVETSDTVTQNLLRGLNEAVLNVQQHAYPGDIATAYQAMPNHHWWLAGYRRAETKEIGFMAYDQGVGIPATLPRKDTERVRDILEKASQAMQGGVATVDHLLLQRATEIGRTRTGLSSQGKGLNDFKKLITDAGGKGSLQILSGSGSYLYSYDGKETAVPLPQPFHGTLIIWRLIGSPAVSWEDPK